MRVRVVTHVPSLRRMHLRKDGTPKVSLSPRRAAAARKSGLRTYLCPICGHTHAGNPVGK